MRLNKFIASNSKYSRRDADKLIFSGKVKVNGETIVNPAVRVDVSDKVMVENNLLNVADKFFYYKFYKPKYCLTSYGDDFNRKNLNDFDFLKKKKPAYSGRLDFESEGLILFSNNGDLIYRLQRPEYKVSKVYTVKTDGELNKKERSKFAEGFSTENEIYSSCKILRLRENTYRVVLFEGKNRQIRKMFEYFNISVTGLKRVAIGPIKLEKMKAGNIIKLNDRELTELSKCIELEL